MSTPLADMLRPTNIDEVVGQSHLLGEGKALRNIILTGKIPNMIFYGPSGIGKTTIAQIIANTTNKTYYKLNATTAGISEIKEIISSLNTLITENGVLLYLDEIQFFNKKQQQTLLEFIENGSITLIASTAENPHFYVYKAILSRSIVFEFKPISNKDIVTALKRAKLILQKNNNNLNIQNTALEFIASISNGDVRKSLNVLDLCTLTASNKNSDKFTITKKDVEDTTLASTFSYDKTDDMHYDVLSAYQKSMRGSDVDAAIYYLSVLLAAGDMPSACRRLMVCACEDVGLANPQIIPIVKSCVDAALMLGMPEARIPLADAVALVALSPKSNSAYTAVKSAFADVENGNFFAPPMHLRGGSYSGAKAMGHGVGYKYAHAYESSYVEQNYLPDELVGKTYYEAGNNKNEQAYKDYWKKIKNR